MGRQCIYNSEYVRISQNEHSIYLTSKISCIDSKLEFPKEVWEHAREELLLCIEHLGKPDGNFSYEGQQVRCWEDKGTRGWVCISHGDETIDFLKTSWKGIQQDLFDCINSLRIQAHTDPATNDTL